MKDLLERLGKEIKKTKKELKKAQREAQWYSTTADGVNIGRYADEEDEAKLDNFELYCRCWKDADKLYGKLFSLIEEYNKLHIEASLKRGTPIEKIVTDPQSDSIKKNKDRHNRILAHKRLIKERSIREGTNWMDIAEFRDLGFIYEINRRMLHPVGLALSVSIDNDGKVDLHGVQDFRNDPEGMIFKSFREDYKEKIDALINEKAIKRLRSFGYVIQDK